MHCVRVAYTHEALKHYFSFWQKQNHYVWKYISHFYKPSYTYRPFVGSGKPSSVQATCGVGLPAAEHFSETAGPGWSVCSMKLYSNTGGASATENYASYKSVYGLMFKWKLLNQRLKSPKASGGFCFNSPTFCSFFVKVMCVQYLIKTHTRTNAMHIHITHNNYPAFARFSLPLHSLSHLCAMKSALWINYEKLCKGTRRSKANMFFLPGIYVYIHIFVCTSSARARGFRVHPLPKPTAAKRGGCDLYLLIFSSRHIESFAIPL